MRKVHLSAAPELEPCYMAVDARAYQHTTECLRQIPLYSAFVGQCVFITGVLTDLEAPVPLRPRGTSPLP